MKVVDKCPVDCHSCEKDTVFNNICNTVDNATELILSQNWNMKQMKYPREMSSYGALSVTV